MPDTEAARTGFALYKTSLFQPRARFCTLPRMTFEIPAAAYDRYMGRYSRRLAAPFAEFAGVTAGMRVLDVGSGTGVLTLHLAQLVGAENVAAVDPALGFLESCRAKAPLVDARLAPAESLPFATHTFDAALSQLAVSFMSDAPAAVREMRRVVRAGGSLAACMWESGEGMQMVHLFWQAMQALRPHSSLSEPSLRYRSEPELSTLWQAAGLERVETESLAVTSEYASFEDFWVALLGAAGPVGAQLATLDESERESLRERCWEQLKRPTAAFTLSARAWAVRGVNPSDA